MTTARTKDKGRDKRSDKQKAADELREKRDKDLEKRREHKVDRPWDTGEHKNYDPNDWPPNSPADSHYV